MNPEIKKLARLEAARLVRQWQTERVDSAAGVRALLRAGIERVALAAVGSAAGTWRLAPPTIEELSACPWWRFRGAIRRVSSTADTIVEHAPAEDRHDPGQAPWLDVPGRDGALPLAWFNGEWMPFATAGIEHAGAHHRHRLRIVDIAGEPHIEVSEPGKAGCTCVVRRPLSDVVHLLLNITDAEWWPISSRDRDAAGHAHEVPDPLHPNGACTCGGEGRCTWCTRTAVAEEEAPEALPVAALDPPVIELANPDDRPEGYRFSAEGGLALAVSPDLRCERCEETGSYFVGNYTLGCPCVKRRAAAYVKAKAGGAA